MTVISINDNIMMFVCLHYYLVSGLQIHKWNSIESKSAGFVTLFVTLAKLYISSFDNDT